MDKKDIASFGYDELIEEMKQIGEKPFRAKQIYSWLHEKLADSFDEMTNLSKALREKLDHEYEIKKVTMAARQISQVDPTEKFLFELEDGNMIESVLMKYNYGNSVCIDYCPVRFRRSGNRPGFAGKPEKRGRKPDDYDQPSLCYRRVYYFRRY